MTLGGTTNEQEIDGPQVLRRELIESKEANWAMTSQPGGNRLGNLLGVSKL
jgi:hypothetical protein